MHAGKGLTRRFAAVATLVVAVSLLIGIAQAQDIAYRGYRIDASRIADLPRREAILSSTRCQIDIIEAVGLPKATTDFFRGIPIQIVPGVGSGSFSRAGLKIGAQKLAQRTPVVLHEYLHAFHARQLPDGARNADVLMYYRVARQSGKFPPDAYMLKNPNEFFAMTGTAVLNGHIERDPYTRSQVREAMPRLYAWLLKTFAVDETKLPSEDAGSRPSCGMAG